MHVKHRLENRNGFTLAELLVVVAIIGVLVAISIPIFRNQLRRSRFATNQANARTAEAAAIVAFLDTGKLGWTYDIGTGTVSAIHDAWDRATQDGRKRAGLSPEDGVVTGWITTDPSDWNFQEEKDSTGRRLRELGNMVYTRIGVDLNADGTVKYYYFYQ